MKHLFLIVLTAIVVLVVACPLVKKERFNGDEQQRCEYLKDMVKYLTLIVRMHHEQRQVYKISNGYAMTFSSPRLVQLEKQRQFFIEKVKKDPQELAFFRENLTFAL